MFRMDFILMRHGEAATSRAGAEVVASEPSLTPLGRRQAARAAAFLRHVGIDHIVCSPMLRSLQTAAIVSRELRLRPHVMTLVAERGLGGAHPGLTRSQLLAECPDAVLPPEVDEGGWARHWQGEDYDELDVRMGRMRDVVLGWIERADFANVLYVGHGGSMNALLRHLMGVKPGSYLRFVHDHCGITPLRFEADPRHGSPKCTVVNERRHLIGVNGSADTAPVDETAFLDWWSIPTKPWPPE